VREAVARAKAGQQRLALRLQQMATRYQAQPQWAGELMAIHNDRGR
jgi:hypothetical protein